MRTLTATALILCACGMIVMIGVCPCAEGGDTFSIAINLSFNYPPVVGYNSDNLLGPVTTGTDGSGDINLLFRVKDVFLDSCAFTTGSAQYSTDGGGTWYAVADGSLLFSPSSTFASATGWTGTEYTVTWASHNELSGYEGSNVKLRVKVTDGKVNSEYGTSAAFTVDNKAPVHAGATVTIDGGAAYSRDTTLDFTWTGFTDAHAVSAYYYSFTDNSGTESGTQTGASPGQLTGAAEGTVSVYVWAKDAYGNTGGAAVDGITVDTIAPAAPVINRFVHDEQGRIVEIRGTAEADAGIEMFSGGSLLGLATADGSGNWTFAPGTPLAGGASALSARAEDAATNQSPLSTSVSVGSLTVGFNTFEDFSMTRSGPASLRLEKQGEYEFKIAVNEGLTPDPDEPVTVRAWMRKNSDYTGSAPTLTLTGPGIDGTGAATASMTAEAGTWEQLTVTGAPNEQGVALLKVKTYATADAAKVWVDDITVSQ